jgi:hypothetical protein
MIVRRGARPTLTLRGEQRALDEVETTVSDETLTIDPHGQHIDRVEVTITLSRLRAVEAESAGDIRLVDVDSGALELRLEGAGELTASGHVATLHASLDGAGELQLADLTAERATVRVDGLGKASVNVTGELDAIVTGVGDIEYLADPIVRSDVQGLGDVSPAKP